MAGAVAFLLVCLSMASALAQARAASAPGQEDLLESLPPPASGTPHSPSAAVPVPSRVNVPRLSGRLQASQLGLVINTADPYSVAVGQHYLKQRGLAPEQVLRLKLPLGARLSLAEFEALRDAIDRHFGPPSKSAIQALALAWVQPFGVGCNSLSGALALGYDAELCNHSCGRSRTSPYFNVATARPATDLSFRPSMQLAALNVAQAREMIDRGLASDATLGQRGAPPALALLLTTGDAARNVRAALYPPAATPSPFAALGLKPLVMPAAQAAAALHDSPGPVAVLQVGLMNMAGLDLPPLAPGALADHLTSLGGVLDRAHDQSTALDWIAAGATASHGAASEPCNHLQKFPHPLVLMAHYAQGATAIEAYWKSVAWPQQSVFVGEPLAAPFARRGAR